MSDYQIGSNSPISSLLLVKIAKVYANSRFLVAKSENSLGILNIINRKYGPMRGKGLLQSRAYRFLTPKFQREKVIVYTEGEKVSCAKINERAK